MEKTDSSGVEEWNRTFDGIRLYFNEYSIVETDNGYMLLGTFGIIKTYSQGIQKWVKIFRDTKIIILTKLMIFTLAYLFPQLFRLKKRFFFLQRILTTFILKNATSGSGDRDFWIAKCDSYQVWILVTDQRYG